ncbi:MAG: leucyl aminopeptidase family protein, partial [Pseudomonadota bacterium]
MTFPTAHAADITELDQYDLTVVVSDQESSVHFKTLAAEMDNAREFDPRVGQNPSLIVHHSFPGGRLLHVPTGRLDRDYDDVRRIFDLGRNSAGLLSDLDAKKILVSVELENVSDRKKAHYYFATENYFFGLCQGLYQPLEARQALKDNLTSLTDIGLIGIDSHRVSILTAIEAGKNVARDLCGTEPERMAPPGFAAYCHTLFENTCVSVEIVEDEHTLLTEYPGLHAVARASLHVPRHAPRVIKLVYESEGTIDKTLFFAGKGITFDTGGVDLKVNGHMAGMSRDKGGGAAVAGLMYVLSLIKPTGLRVEAQIAAVRNNVDAEAYTPDEIITSHSGVRVRVGNTDAEGRLVLMDILSHFREKAGSAVHPEIFSFATLT